MALNIELDTETCIGSENCARYAPRTFATDATGKVMLLDGEHDDDDVVSIAVAACPVAALSIQSTKGADDAQAG